MDLSRYEINACEQITGIFNSNPRLLASFCTMLDSVLSMYFRNVANINAEGFALQSALLAYEIRGCYCFMADQYQIDQNLKLVVAYGYVTGCKIVIHLDTIPENVNAIHYSALPYYQYLN